MTRMHRGSRWALAAAVAGSLGFGATQALAAPGAEAERRVCNSSNCPQIICKCQNGQCIDREGGFWCFS
ncbi:MAG TPA: hypothetical protein VFR37_21810 [Longimicrobium sp.]|nr:hypothetical protein [Longimicrobium sp.]